MGRNRYKKARLRKGNEPQVTDKQEWPLCWTEDEKNEYCSMYEWLTFKDQKLGCAMCRAFRKLGPLGEIWAMRKWARNEIKGSGEMQNQQQKSLMTKMKTHDGNACHVAAVFWIRYQKTNGINIILNPVPHIKKVAIPRIKRPLKKLKRNIIISETKVPTEARTVMDEEKVIEAPSPEKQEWPKCWTKKNKIRYCKKNVWLNFKDQKLGCWMCATYSRIAPPREPSSRWDLANKMWINYEITCDDEKCRLELQMISLMKKVMRHKASPLHAAAASWITKQETSAHVEQVVISQIGDSPMNTDKGSMESGRELTDGGEKEELGKETVLPEKVFEVDPQTKMICGKLDLLIDLITQLVKKTEENAEEMRMLRGSVDKRSLSKDDVTITSKKIKLEV